MKLNNSIKQVNKTKVFIYLFSYITYIILNNLISNLVNLPLRRGLFFNIVGIHNAPCTNKETVIYIASCFLIKLLLFFCFALLIQKRKNIFLIDFIYSYFIYDTIFLFSRIWDLFGFFNFFFLDLFFSSHQVLLEPYLKYSAIYISILWSLMCCVILYKNQFLSLSFFLKRFFLALLSILLYIVIFTAI